MAEKLSLCIFILCGILCQAIIEVTSADAGESNSLVRRKRVINFEPDGDQPLRSGDAPFVANIRAFPSNTTICVGAILSKHTVITAAVYIEDTDVLTLKVLVGSAYSFRGKSHNVIETKVHAAGHHQAHWESIALVIVEPAITFDSHTQFIELHVGPLMAGIRATIYGWGCNENTPRGTNFRNRLRAINVPIMRHQDCVNAYRNRLVITEKEICTFDPFKRCGHTDYGAPLVVDNKLAGVHLRRTFTPTHINPDVFAILQHVANAQWIRNNIVHYI